MNKLISNVPKRTREGLKHLAPLIAARRKEHKENRSNPETQVCSIFGGYNQYSKLINSAQSDLLTWLFEEGKEDDTTDLTLRILGINFAAIHTSSVVCCNSNYIPNKFLKYSRKTFTDAFYYLAAFPEYAKPLREEVEEVIEREGWTKAGIDQMHKIDSFIKESLRLRGTTVSKPIVILDAPRKLISSQPVRGELRSTTTPFLMARRFLVAQPSLSR